MILRGAKIILFLACTLETRIAARLGSARVYIAAWKAPPTPGPTTTDRWAAWLRRCRDRGTDIWREGKAIRLREHRVESSRRWSFRSRKSIPSLLRIRKGGSGFQIFLRIDPRCAFQFSFSSSFSFFDPWARFLLSYYTKERFSLWKRREREREILFSFFYRKKRREEGRR